MTGWVDLAAGGRPAGPWRALGIPGAAPPVQLARLHADALTGASVLLVSFPPGWHRPGTGHYLVGEEFVVLRGDLRVNGERFAAGDWAWAPPLASRAASRSAGGALALAWFSGKARWRDGPGQAPPVICRAGLLEPGPRRIGTADVPGGSAVVDLSSVKPDGGPARLPAGTDRDLLDAARMRWCFLPAGSTPPACQGSVLLRNWSR